MAQLRRGHTKPKSPRTRSTETPRAHVVSDTVNRCSMSPWVSPRTPIRRAERRGLGAGVDAGMYLSSVTRPGHPNGNQEAHLFVTVHAYITGAISYVWRLPAT